jgi:hypothetical protein
VPAWPTQVVDHLVPNQVLGFFEFFRERERGKFSVFKGLQEPYRRRFKNFEDAPLAAYGFCSYFVLLGPDSVVAASAITEGAEAPDAPDL